MEGAFAEFRVVSMSTLRQLATAKRRYYHADIANYITDCFLSSLRFWEGPKVLSITAQYALRAVVYLAGCSDGTPVRAAELAEAVEVPPNYMGKILNQLVRARILRSVRGKKGGFEVALPAEDISLHRVVSQFDDLGLEDRCLFGRLECSDENPCPAHERWGKVAAQILDFFNTTTIADVIE
jgi:Rrf2 family protein